MNSRGSRKEKAMILDRLADAARRRVERQKKVISPEEMERKAFSMDPDTGFPFEKALALPSMSFICECKKASPSKGLIAPEFPYLEIARSYQDAGADAISCLTEPKWFLGSDTYLKEIAEAVNIPVLRKDFTVDPYMIYEAKVLGASAVLLIVSILSEKELKEYLRITEELGLSALTETHDEAEVKLAQDCGAKIIGVNNRCLRDFKVDPSNSIRLRSLINEDVLMVAESGIKTREDVLVLQQNGIHGVLIGETLMKAEDRKKKLRELKGETV